MLLLALIMIPRLAIALVPAVMMTLCLGVMALLARTRTVSWRSLTILLSVGAAWAPWVAAMTGKVGSAVGVSTSDDGMLIALAAFVEEPGKLIPLMLLAVLAPGRMRRLATVDWAHIGFASGAGFTIAEDFARRAAQPGLLAEILGENRLSYSLNPWSSGSLELSTGGLSEIITGDDPTTMVVGHHVSTMLVATGIGLSISLWRARRRWWRFFAWFPPVALMALVISDHACYNAMVGSGTAFVDSGSFPFWMTLLWWVCGQGYLQPVLSFLLFGACVIADSHRRLLATTMGATVFTPPRLPALSSVPVPLRVIAHACVASALFAWHDSRITLAAYTDPALDRAARMVHGRSTMMRFGDEHRRAMAATTPGAEPTTRRLWAAAAAAISAVVLVTCLIYGAHVAESIGSLVSVPGNDGHFFAGLLDQLADWWDSLGAGGQILITALLALWLLCGSLSLPLALGATGVLTWALAHGHGLASLLRDPGAATRSYLANVTLGQFLLDLVDFALTFVPGSAFAASGRAAAHALGGNVARASEREAEHAANAAARQAEHRAAGEADDAAHSAGRESAREAKNYHSYVDENGVPHIDPNDPRPYLNPNNRPSFRKGVVEEVWRRALARGGGKVIDPSTHKEIIWTPGTPRKGVWDMGHVPDQQYRDVWRRYINGEMTPKEFRDWYNDPVNYRPELPGPNRGGHGESIP